MTQKVETINVDSISKWNKNGWRIVQVLETFKDEYGWLDKMTVLMERKD